MIPFTSWAVHGVWGKPAPFTGPAKGVVVHHTVTTITDDPIDDARFVEQVTYDRNVFAALPYSYLLHPDGTAFEGRGVSYQNGANRNDKGGQLSNSNTVSVALIGDYRTDLVTDRQRHAFDLLLGELYRSGDVVPNPVLTPHSALAYTECPAAALEQLLTPALNDLEDAMQTLVSNSTGEAWVVAGNRARPISDVDQWLRTFDGPVLRAHNMEYVVSDLYEIV